MAAEEGDVITFIFTGEEGEVIPRNATHFIAHESVTVIPERLFQRHPNIVELICHAGVIRIERGAFQYCPRLGRVIIPGVKVIEYAAFYGCVAMTYIECPNLERIGDHAFEACRSLSNIDLPSAKIVEYKAFQFCEALADVKFGKNLESIRGGAFRNSRSLERITIPLKNGIIAVDDIFQLCRKLKSVDLVEGAVLRKTITALLLGEWRDDMSDEINSINQILPSAPAGDNWFDRGGKARAIREWIERVLHKIIHYKAEHRRLLTEAATSLMHALPNDIVMNNVIPFLELPFDTFEGEDQEEENGSNSSDDNEESNDMSEGAEDGEDGGEDDNSNNDELHNASLGGNLEAEEGGEDGGRKRRKKTNDNEEA